MTRPAKISAPAAESDATLAQRRAADPAASVWVGASAGSGKTKVLTDRLLRLLLPREDGQPGSRPDRILCLTFTKAGAREMGLRLGKRLASWAVMDDATLRDDLGGQLLGREPDAQELRAARRLFAAVTDAPGGLKIMTIHAFCQSVLGRFPLEAGLLPSFTALDEGQAASLRNAARDQVLAEAGRETESPLGQALNRIAHQVGLDGFDKLLGEVVRECRQVQHLLRHDDFAAQLRLSLGAAFGIAGDDHDDLFILRAAFADGAFDDQAIRQAGLVMAQNTSVKTDPQRAQALLDWLSLAAEERLARLDDYAGAFLKDDGQPYVNIMTKKLAAAHPHHDAALRMEADRLMELRDRRNAAHGARLTHDLLTLGLAVWQRYETAKTRRGALDFDDMINKTLDLLGQDGIASWVMYKLDGGLDHILIDEAQDTNPEQWEIVKKLSGDFFTGQGAREDVTRTIFAVGDEKQSIYSFQRARPEKFYETRRYFSDLIQRPHRWSTEPLHTSFRTVPSILRFVDTVFADPALQDSLSREEITHVSHRAGQGGFVELWPLFTTPEKEDRAPFDPPLRAVESRGGAARLADHIGATIRGWLDTRERLVSQDRPIAPGDILVLVRRRSAFVGQLIRALKIRGIAVSGVDRMVLKNELAVQDMVAAAQFALLPDDDLTLACLLKSPLCGWDDVRLEGLAAGRPGTLWAALQATRDTDLLSWLDGLIASAATERPYEFFAQLMQRPCPANEKSGLHAMTARLGQEALDPLQEFLNAALQADRDAVPSLQTFLVALAQGESELKREQEEAGNAVRIMTVHGAKGLQAPIVIIPDTMPSAPRQDRLIWPDRSGLDVPVWSPRKNLDCRRYAALLTQLAARQEAEQHRLLYVALTRAEDRLYIAGHAGRKTTAMPGWYDHMQAAMGRLADAEKIPFTSASFPATGDGAENFAWRLANAQIDAPRVAQGRAAPPADAATLPAWLFRPPAAEPDPAYPLTPSRPALDEPAAQSPLSPLDPFRFRRGIVTHKLLQLLPDLPASARRAQAQGFVARHAHDLPEKVRLDIVAETMAILEHLEWAPLFGPDSLAEISVTGLSGGRLVSGQIDRLYLAPDAVWIVDYKTNRPPPTAEDAIPPAYRAQMEAYRDIVAAIYKTRTVRCFLLWTDGPFLMPVER